MPEDFSIDALAANDSFLNFCFRRNEEDILFWEEYMIMHPASAEKLKEAKEIVLGLHIMFRQDRQQHVHESSQAEIVQFHKRPRIIKWMFPAAAAAAILLIFFSVRLFEGTGKASVEIDKKVSDHGAPLDKDYIFVTAKGEKKECLLPDSSTVKLAAGSVLMIDRNFNSTNRSVHLTGEAMFDVTHNKELPFIVHCAKYDVRVLGTLFNVKSYADDDLSETTLLRGKVEILPKDASKKVVLFPNQKAVVGSKSLPHSKKVISDSIKVPVKIMPLSYDLTDSVIIETAWTQSRIEIINERFDEIRKTLERWYNVQIVFADEEVAGYTFTATFTNETIVQILDVLKYTYQFTYEIEGNTITIRK
ncbi:MAG: DUF4974 domain-containing protein [Chitinophagaceae bacterium]|nr:DUF4974 domain-containing protein [Chitinophagaceae bacterium]